MKINRNIVNVNSQCYRLNGCRVWFAYGSHIVHVGNMASIDKTQYISETHDTLHELVRTLYTQPHGKLEINCADPIIKRFLKLTKCI